MYLLKKICRRKIKPIAIHKITNTIQCEINDIMLKYNGPDINLHKLDELNEILQNRQSNAIRNATNTLFQKIIKYHVNVYKCNDIIYGVLHNNNNTKILRTTNQEYSMSINTAVSIINQSKIFPPIKIVYDVEEDTLQLLVNISF